VHRFLVLFFALVFALTSAVTAIALENENLLVSMPSGYKVGFNDRKKNMIISEMVPAAETVENWTEMVTVQIFLGMKDSVMGFRLRMEKLWAAACAGAKSAPVSSGIENGYVTSMWRLSCPLNKQTGKPEMTWFKTISGHDSFYVVQKAFKAEPPPEKAAEWVAWLNKVSVCDSRIPQSKCPSGMR